ncbi:MAG: 6-bladed beta-propeller [Candidatus Delongbacteria bacterium]|nr:6-bladed beta-propeller [Candidatus Delongbacteria bacterium]
MFSTYIKIIIPAAFLILFSCGLDQSNSVEIIDGITVYKNGNYPVERDLGIKTELLFTLNQDTGDTTDVIRSISAIESDYDGNIYVLDRRRGSVFKYSGTGELKKVFGNRGNGPGEMTAPMEMLCADDTLYIADRRLRKVIVFNTVGEYIRDIIPLRDNGFPESMVKMSDGNFAGILFGRSGGRGSSEMSLTYNLAVLDRKFEKKADIVSKKIEVDFREFMPDDHLNKFIYGQGKIYVAENTEGKYQINVYDSSGEKKEEIRKSYARVSYTEEERLFMKEEFETRYRWREIDVSKFRHKKAISDLFYHKDGYLLVDGGRKRNGSDMVNFIVDIFKDGVYLNTVDINKENPEFYHNPDGFEKVLIGDRLFVYNNGDNEIFVYKIQISG